MTQLHKLHIVHLVATLDGGGIQNLVLGLATTSPLSDCRHSVISLLGTRGDLVDAYRAAGISLYTCWVQWPRRVRMIPRGIMEWIRTQAERTFSLRLALLLKMIKADVVHTHIPRSIDLVTRSSLQLGDLPLIWSIHGENIFLQDSQPDSLHKAVKMFVRSGRAWITADSAFLAQGFIRHFPEAEKIIRVVNAGADTRRFQQDIPKDPNWRKIFEIPESAIVFGSCGRLAPVKGFDIFVQAAASLVDRGVDAYFAISGKGPSYENLSAQITQLGLSEHFHLLGFQENLPYTYKQFDVFVMSSRSEGFPLSLIEALASGLPCIATDVSGVREMFGDHGGLVVPPESPTALMEAMQLMLSLETRRNFSAESQARGNKYSYENCALEFFNLYRSFDIGSNS
jgi:glycosyltransferase involved in cell wall biosynthesis